MMTTGVLNCYLKDHLGTTRVVLDASGTVLETRDHYPFGLEMPGRSYLSGTKAKENFTGHELDDENGLIYAGARYYMPDIGRWMSVDPLADMYASHSSYNYVLNNPVVLFDPDGRCVSQSRMGSECFSYPVFAICPPGTEDCNEEKNEEEEAESNEGVGDQINTGAEAVSLGLDVQTAILKMSGATDSATKLLTKISGGSAGALSLFGMAAGASGHWNAAFSGEHSPQKVHARASIQFYVATGIISMIGPKGAIVGFVLTTSPARQSYVDWRVNRWIKANPDFSPLSE